MLVVDADPQRSASKWAEEARKQERQAPNVATYDIRRMRSTDLPGLKADNDIVIIDCPARQPEVQRAALMASDAALVPSAPSVVDAWALNETFDLVQRVAIVRSQLKSFVLINRQVARTHVAAGARSLLSNYGFDLLKSEWGNRIAFQAAPKMGLGVTAFAPMSKAADEVRALADEVHEAVRAPSRPKFIAPPVPIRDRKAFEEYERLRVYEPAFAQCS